MRNADLKVFSRLPRSSFLEPISHSCFFILHSEFRIPQSLHHPDPQDNQDRADHPVDR